MDSAPPASLHEFEERCRMSNRLWVAWPWLMALTLVSAPMLHQAGITGLGLVLGPALGGLLLTLVVVLQARRPRQVEVPMLMSSEAASPSVSSSAA